MYNVGFWYLSKRVNSTFHPDKMYPTEEYECDLLDNSGILTPTLQLTGTNPTIYNYCYISAFNRFYWVNNWRYNLGLWTCELQVDVLASWEEDIKTQAVYVMRSSSAYDLDIRDTMYPMLSGAVYSDASLANPFNTSYANGYFIVGIVNTDQNTRGAISYYAFTSTQFRQFMAVLMSDINNYGYFDITTDLTKLVANPFQYVVSCRWMPMAPPTGGTAVSSVPLGWWTFSCNATRLGSSSIIQDSSDHLTIPRHPQLSRGRYLQGAPYTDYYLIYAPFGAFSLPADNMILSDQLYFEWSADYITGAAVLIVKNGGTIVTRVEGVLGADIALAQMAPQIQMIQSPQFTKDAPQLDGTAGSVSFLGVDLSEIGEKMSGAYAAKNPAPRTKLETIAENAITGVANAFLSTLCPAQVTGNNGGITGGRFDIRLCVWFHLIGEESLNEKGRPLCQYRSLYGMSGYVQCGETDISIPCTKPEIDAIKLYLINGFFLE